LAPFSEVLTLHGRPSLSGELLWYGLYAGDMERTDKSDGLKTGRTFFFLSTCYCGAKGRNFFHKSFKDVARLQTGCLDGTSVKRLGTTSNLFHRKSLPGTTCPR